MKRINNSLYLLIAVMALGGCKKELQQDDPTKIIDTKAFTTFEHVQLGVNGAFGRYGAYSTDMYANALVSDEGKLGINNSGQGALTYRYQYSSDNTTGGDVIAGYFPYYSLIDQVNRVLPWIYTVTANCLGEILLKASCWRCVPPHTSPCFRLFVKTITHPG